jgi:regulator of protease activity HflC (stomatin/prohibitin superfamily)
MKKTMLVLALAAVVTGCSQQVPPAHLGKELTRNGYSTDVIPPSRVYGYGLINSLWAQKQLILLETGTQMVEEPLKMRLADRVELNFDVRIRTRIAGDERTINSMFNDITPQNGRVSLAMVYHTYGQMIVRNKAREVMSAYTVEDVQANYARISVELFEAFKEGFKHIPLEIEDVTLGNISWPVEVTEAINATARARAEIAKIEADKLKEIADAEAREAIALANRAAQLVEAQTIRDYNLTIADGVSEEFLRFKAIQLQEEIAKRGSGEGNTTVYMPYDALGTIGAQQRMFGK